MANLIDAKTQTIDEAGFNKLISTLSKLDKIEVPNGRQFVKLTLSQSSKDFKAVKEAFDEEQELAIIKNTTGLIPTVELTLEGNYNIHSIPGFYDEVEQALSSKRAYNLSVASVFELPTATRFKMLLSKALEKKIKELTKDLKLIPSVYVELKFSNVEQTYTDFLDIEAVLSFMQA